MSEDNQNNIPKKEKVEQWVNINEALKFFVGKLSPNTPPEAQQKVADSLVKAGFAAVKTFDTLTKIERERMEK